MPDKLKLKKDHHTFCKPQGGKCVKDFKSLISDICHDQVKMLIMWEINK